MPDRTNHMRARIEVECKRQSISLSECARRMGRSPQSFQDILRRGNPTLQTMSEIAAALNIEMSVLTDQVSEEEYGRHMIPRTGTEDG